MTYNNKLSFVFLRTSEPLPDRKPISVNHVNPDDPLSKEIDPQEDKTRDEIFLNIREPFIEKANKWKVYSIPGQPKEQNVMVIKINPEKLFELLEEQMRKEKRERQ